MFHGLYFQSSFQKTFFEIKFSLLQLLFPIRWLFWIQQRNKLETGANVIKRFITLASELELILKHVEICGRYYNHDDDCKWRSQVTPQCMACTMNMITIVINASGSYLMPLESSITITIISECCSKLWCHSYDRDDNCNMFSVQATEYT